MKPPSVAHTILKLVIAKVGITVLVVSCLAYCYLAKLEFALGLTNARQSYECDRIRE